MKATPAENERIARQLERTAEIIRTTGPKAWQLADDWSKSTLRSANTDPGRGVGGHGDPTANASTGWEHKPGACPSPDRYGDCPGHMTYDSPGEQWAYLTAELGRAYDAAVTAGERILNIARIAVAENERKGIGMCANPGCDTYCDGKKRRLRNGICPACDQRERRERETCSHDKQVWHNGVRTCCGCGVELTEAGVAK